MTTVHVIGAGLAGLAAAVRLAGQTIGGTKIRVIVHEAAPQAGGRCRSFHDSTLDRIIDNGSHLVLSGNRSLLGLLRRVGAGDGLVPVRPAAFPFLDLRDGRAWTVRPGGLWLLDRRRRVPDSRPLDYLAALKTLKAPPEATVADLLPPHGPLLEKLWGPLSVSVMNGPADRVSARLFGAVLRETLLRGERACRPLIAPGGLSAAIVEPLVRWLRARGAVLRLGTRVDGIEFAGDRVAALSVNGQRLELGPDDQVVLAVPAWVAERLVPGLTVPPPGAAIVNAHFRLQAPVALPGALPFLGLIGGTAEWLFARGDVVAVTVSAADALADLPADEVAERLWRDVAAALRLEGLRLEGLRLEGLRLEGPSRASPPPNRVVKERRATPDQSPDAVARRPGPVTRWNNLVLAGDWTDTGLPATLEAAVRSGERAAGVVLTGRDTPFVRPGPFPAFTLWRHRPIWSDGGAVPQRPGPDGQFKKRG